MKQEVQQRLRRFAHDNRGAGLIMVIITMLCVTLMGATLMYMSYIALKMKNTEQKATVDFYDASEAVDRIRAGLQVVVSDALDTAYTEAIVHYNDPSYYGAAGTAEAEKKFAETFMAAVTGWKYTDGGEVYTLKTDIASKNNVFCEKIFTDIFLSGASNVTVAEPEANSFVVNRNGSGIITSALIKGIHVTCTDSTGYSTSVTTDIEIKVPAFRYVFSEHSLTGLPEFIIIAQGDLTVGSGFEAELYGDAYVNNIRLSDNTTKLTHSSGTLVCGGEVVVNNSARLSQEVFGKLWTNKIILGSRAELTLAGETNVADDLVFIGAEAAAVLKGYYYGFGDSISTPGQSSAILVNSNDITLDMELSKSLTLAGHSFIGNSYGFEESADEFTMMGQSMATKRDQTMYLVPQHFFDSANPENKVYGNPVVIQGTDAEPTYRLTAEGTAYLTGYGAKVKTLVTNIPGGYKMVYYFLDFQGSTANANLFFRDYFTNNAQQISQYLEAAEFHLVSGQRDQTAGYIYSYNSASGAYGYNTPTTLRDAQKKTTYDRLKTSLHQVPEEGSPVSNPYEYYVLEHKITDGMAVPFYMAYNLSNPVGYVVDGNFVIDETVSAHVRVVIATGNVTVNRNFTGLIICGGNITLGAGVTLSNTEQAAVTAALTAKDTSGVLLGSYLREGVVTEVEGEVELGSSAWNYQDMVSYKNWKKD